MKFLSINPNRVRVLYTSLILLFVCATLIVAHMPCVYACGSFFFWRLCLRQVIYYYDFYSCSISTFELSAVKMLKLLKLCTLVQFVSLGYQWLTPTALIIELQLEPAEGKFSFRFILQRLKRLYTTMLGAINGGNERHPTSTFSKPLR